MFKNLKMGTKILAALTLLVIICIVVGIVGIVNIRKIDNADTVLYEQVTVPVAAVSDLRELNEAIQVDLRGMLFTQNPAEIFKLQNRVKEGVDSMEKLEGVYEKTLLNEQDKKIFQEYLDAKKVATGYIDKFIGLILADKKSEATVLLLGDADRAFAATKESLQTISRYNIDAGKRIGQHYRRCEQIDSDPDLHHYRCPDRRVPGGCLDAQCCQHHQFHIDGSQEPGRGLPEWQAGFARGSGEDQLRVPRDCAGDE